MDDSHATFPNKWLTAISKITHSFALNIYIIIPLKLMHDSASSVQKSYQQPDTTFAQVLNRDDLFSYTTVELVNQWVKCHSQGAVRIRQQLSSHVEEVYTSGAFLLISLSCGELNTVCTPFPTSSSCSGAGGVGGGEGVEGGEDWGVEEEVMGVDSDSGGGMVCDCNSLESHSSNPNTS